MEPATTGHEWDGIREYDNPLPRWWLWVLWATVVWSVGYWIVMPAWPLIDGYTRGVIGYSQRASLERRIDEARAVRAPVLERLAGASLDEIRADPELLDFALAGGRSAFAVNCSQCHGAGAQGATGYPNLNDDDWLWGGRIDQIIFTIRHGIRNGGGEARVSEMPAFERDEVLDRAQIADVVEFVVSLSGRPANGEAAERGAAVYAENCATCHGEGGGGKTELGSPSLTDGIWLYGDDRAAIRDVIANSRGGVMPGWEERLAPVTVKQLAIFVHALGGGE